MQTHQLLTAILDTISPRFCSVCGKPLKAGERGVCLKCLLELRLSPYCDGEKGNALERLFWQDLPTQRAAALMVYDTDSTQRRLILDMKFHNRPRTGYYFGQIMAQLLKGTDFFAGVDVIVPVPIPLMRKLRRGYNQSEQLALGIASITHLPIDTRSVGRKNYKAHQARLSIRQREDNVKGSFRLLRPERLRGRHILMVDDVITSTRTLHEMGRTIAAVPGVRVSVLALAASKNLFKNIGALNPQEMGPYPDISDKKAPNNPGFI